MFGAYIRPRCQVSVYRTIGTLVFIITDVKIGRRVNVMTPPTLWLRSSGFRGVYFAGRIPNGMMMKCITLKWDSLSALRPYTHSDFCNINTAGHRCLSNVASLRLIKCPGLNRGDVTVSRNSIVVNDIKESP